MILIAHASKYGSTREVAEFVAATLRDEGLDVEVVRAADITAVDGYDAVVLGTGLYVGRMHGDARGFLARWHRDLGRAPFAVFAMGPDSLDPAKIAESRKPVDRMLAKFPDLQTVTVGIFGGVVDPSKFHFPLNRIPASDARDWDAIRSWAQTLARELAREPQPSHVGSGSSPM